MIKCISVSPEFSDLANEYNISWSEASRIGMAIMLKDKGIDAYNNPLTIARKKEALDLEIKNAKIKLEELKKQKE